ncbi:hypothetical protein TNCV_2965821 [Trichonephila clavipes]|nr:hypothetical protein TNCV_2965821 [Trichonephila clavipes]
MWNTSVRVTFLVQPLRGVSDTTASLYTISMSVVPCLDTISSYTSGNRSQMTISSRIGVHEQFRSAPSPARRQEFHAASLSDLSDYFWS